MILFFLLLWFVAVLCNQSGVHPIALPAVVAPSPASAFARESPCDMTSKCVEVHIPRWHVFYLLLLIVSFVWG